MLSIIIEKKLKESWSGRGFEPPAPGPKPGALPDCATPRK